MTSCGSLVLSHLNEKAIYSDFTLRCTDPEAVPDLLCSSAENYRLQSAYEKNLIIKMVLVSDFLLCVFLTLGMT